jgi:hypothetical protein
MANQALPVRHPRDGRLNSSTARLTSSYGSFIAASTPGKWPRVRAARRSFEFKASITFVVYMIRRIGALNAKNGITWPQSRRHLSAETGRPP